MKSRRKVTTMRKNNQKSGRIFAYSEKICTFAPLLRAARSLKAPGEVAEWSIAAVLKTVVLRGTGGSNPSLSAERTGQNRTTNRQVPQIQ